MSPASRDGDMAYRTEYNPRNYGEYRPFVGNGTMERGTSGVRHRPNNDALEGSLNKYSSNLSHTVSVQQSRRIDPNNTKSYNGYSHRLKSHSTLDVNSDEMDRSPHDEFSPRNISSLSVTDLTRGIGLDENSSGNLTSTPASGMSSRYLIRHSARRSDSREPWLTSVKVTSALNVDRNEMTSPKTSRGKTRPKSSAVFSSADNVSSQEASFASSSARGDDNDDTLAKEHFPITLFTPAGDPYYRPPVSSSKTSYNPLASRGYATQYGPAISSSPSVTIKEHGKVVMDGHGKPVRTKVNGLRLSTGDGSSRHHRKNGNRSDSVQSSSSSNSCSSIGQMYLMAIESPPGNSNLMLSSTPFETELERLRMDRLRLEEERIVHQKMHVQAQHAKPPVERWYELKSPQFNYELRKHNDRIKPSSGAL